MSITRRRFLSHCAGAAAAAGAAPLLPAAAQGQNRPNVRFPVDPRARVSVASYPFREFIDGPEHKAGNPTMALQDFAAHVVQKFHVHRIEPWSAHFPSTGAAYLGQFRAAVEKAGAGVANIAVDGKESPYAADGAERDKAVAFRKLWVDVARAIGAPGIRTNIPAAKDSKPDAARLIESLRVLADYASTRNVVVHLENDNPVSEDPFFLVKVIDGVNSPWLRALPDFGNTVAAHDADYAYRAIDAMFGRAYGICHVKDGEPNDRGQMTHVDLARTFGILKRRGYKGYCSIEYDAPGDPYKPTADLVEKTVSFLS
jgi:sugar phosphate isomerase/epimerase